MCIRDRRNAATVWRRDKKTGKSVTCPLIFREGELVQQTGGNGTRNSFHCRHRFFGNVFVGFNINNYITPVSYTHLDVYKRQSMRGVAHQRQTVRGKLARITPRQWEQDVYKRQIYVCSATAMALNGLNGAACVNRS